MTVRSGHVLVAGAGALGSVFGGFLRQAGRAVTLLGRPAHLEAIAARGLGIGGLWGDHLVTGLTLATRAQELAGPYAAVLLTVKAYDTGPVVRAVAPYLAPDGVVISLQNGLGNVEAAGEIVGTERVIGGRVIFGAALSAPGRVEVTVYAEPVMLGSPSPGRWPALDAAARAWAEAVAAAGVPCEYTDEIVSFLWAKVLYNAPLNPVGALLGLHYGALAADADLRTLMDAIIDEAHAVATARGVALRWPAAAAFRDEFYGRLVPATFDHRSSMLQDLERGRPTEIDAINGRVWEYGRAAGIATPLNEAMTRLVRAKGRRTGG
jgi:2-dehydropantoate 2-reductase